MDYLENDYPDCGRAVWRLRPSLPIDAGHIIMAGYIKVGTVCRDKMELTVLVWSNRIRIFIGNDTFGLKWII